MPLENWKEAGGAAGRHLDLKVNLIHAANGVTQAMVNLYHRSNFFPFPSFCWNVPRFWPFEKAGKLEKIEAQDSFLSLERKPRFISFTFERSIIHVTAAYLIGARLLAIDDRLIVIVARKIHPTATPPYRDDRFGQELLPYQISSRSIAIFILFF